MTSSSSSKTEFTRIFYDVFDVGGYAGSSRLEVSLLYFFGIPPLPLLTITSRCFDATRLSQSNKLEFAQFGAHMRKLWQFWFLAVVPRPERQYRLSPQAVVPLSKAVVPPMAISGSTATVPRWYRLDFGSCIFRVEFCSSCTAVRHGSSTYKR